MTQTIEHFFDPEQLAIVRKVTNNDTGEVVQEKNVSPDEAVALDESLIEELISYGETYHPSLFANIRDATPEQVNDIRRRLQRMNEALRTLAEYKRQQQPPETS